VSVYKWETEYHKQRSRKRHSVCLNTVYTANMSWRVGLKHLVNLVRKLSKWLQITQLNFPRTRYKSDRFIPVLICSFTVYVMTLNQLYRLHREVVYGVWINFEGNNREQFDIYTPNQEMNRR
jgi:hypothetical protein